MRRPTLPALLLILSATTAAAQVATDDHALDALPPAPAPAKPQAQPAHPAAPAHAKRHGRPVPPAPAAVGKRLPAVAMPAAPPANPVIAPPPFVMPAHPPPPKPPVPVLATAVGVASAIKGGTRITFGPGSSDLNPATVASIRAEAARAASDPAMIVAITAWAPGTADDPSTPRRLSLDRALAVRAVLINAGIASERIRAVAKGMADYGDGIADRADMLELPAGH
jgi:outer membrane protein OmpA-like peptidoglycan-associated protein